MEGLEFVCIRDMERAWIERKFKREDFSSCKRLEKGQSYRFGWFYYSFLSSLLDSSGERCASSH